MSSGMDGAVQCSMNSVHPSHLGGAPLWLTAKMCRVLFSSGTVT